MEFFAERRPGHRGWTLRVAGLYFALVWNRYDRIPYWASIGIGKSKTSPDALVLSVLCQQFCFVAVAWNN